MPMSDTGEPIVQPIPAGLQLCAWDTTTGTIGNSPIRRMS